MNRLLRLARAIDYLNEQVGRLVSWLCLALVLMTLYAVVARYGFNYTKAWYEEIEWHLYALIFLFGAAYTYKHDDHVRVDVFYQRFGPKTQAWINLIGILIFLLPICEYVTETSLESAIRSLQDREVSTESKLPFYPIKFAVPLGFFLLFLQGVAEAIKHLATLRGLNPSEISPQHG